MDRFLLTDGYSVNNKLPANYKESEYFLFENDHTYVNHKVYGYTYTEATIRYPLFYEGNEIIEVIANNLFPGKSSILLKFVRFVKVLSSFDFFPLRKQSLNGKFIWISNTLSNGYFHWMCDVLPKIALLLKKDVGACDYTVLIQDKYKNMEYVEKTLQVLGFSVHFFNESDHLEVDKLIFIPDLAVSGNYYPKSINLLRLSFINSYKYMMRSIDLNRVYISRNKATRRKIENESDVEKVVKKYGFSIFYFEDFSIEQQIEIMVNANLLISLHGAGLTNMLFMRNNSKILEIRSSGDSHRNCYFSLASSLGHDYYYVLSKNIGNDLHSGNVSVNTSKLSDTIKKMIEAY